MDLVTALSIGFLVSPLIGYLVIALPISVRAKIAVAVLGAAVLIVVPILVLVFAGGG